MNLHVVGLDCILQLFYVVQGSTGGREEHHDIEKALDRMQVIFKKQVKQVTEKITVFPCLHMISVLQ